MSLRIWLILFILSMAASAEVLVWAVRHGQFTDVNRGNSMPLRRHAPAVYRSRHCRWRLAAFFGGLLVLVAVCISGLNTIMHFALGR